MSGMSYPNAFYTIGPNFSRKIRPSSMAKPFVPRKKFEFKIFTTIKEILEYLNITSYLHMFTDSKMTSVSEFYSLDEFKLKKMLMPKQIRTLILKYIVFFNKKVRKERKQRLKKQQQDFERRQRMKEKLKIKEIHNVSMVEESI